MTIHTYGANAVDWEQRVDLPRLRTERLARLKAQLEASSLGALLSFDFANIRYMTATHIGTWGMDKLVRFALLPRGGEPVVWDFGSAARHHQIYNPWLDHTDGPPTPEGARATGRAGGHLHAARGAPSGRGHGGGCGGEGRRRAARARPGRRAGRRRRGRDAGPGRACATAGIETVDGQQVFMEAQAHQDQGRDLAAEPRLRDGRRGVPAAL